MAVQRNLLPLEGLRVIQSLWVVWLHTTILILYCSYSSDLDISVGRRYQFTYWNGTVRSFATQVDIFFMISGFLLYFQLLSSSDRFDQYNTVQKILTVLLIGAKKAIRLIPAVLAVAVIAHYTDDIGNRPLLTLLQRSILMGSDGEPTPVNIIVTWSNGVDIKASMVITALFLLAKASKANLKRFTLVCIALCLLKLVVALRLHPEYSVANITRIGKYHIPQFMSPARVAWARERFNLPYLPDAAANDRVIQGYSEVFYFCWYHRITPFFIGQYMAICYHEELTGAGKRKEEKNSNIGWGLWCFHSVAFVSMLLVYAAPTLLGIVQVKVTARAQQQKSDAGTLPVLRSDVSDLTILDYFFVILLRPIVAAANAYLLYRLILPAHHPLKLTSLSRFLSMEVFQHLGVLTYSIYLLHFRFVFELVLGWMPLATLSRWMGTTHYGFLHLLFYASTACAVTVLAAIPLHYLVEVPCMQLGNKMLHTVRKRLLDVDDRNKND